MLKLFSGRWKVPTSAPGIAGHLKDSCESLVAITIPTWDRGPVDHSVKFAFMFRLHHTNFKRWASSGITRFGGVSS